jgi:hypothetical protein
MSTPRGIRNYNPGNIEFGPFAQRHGATGTDGRFAIFPDMGAGYAAQEALLRSYMERGYSTPQDIIARWAPASDGNHVGNYTARVAAALGLQPNQPVPPDMLPRLAEAMAEVENGRPVPRVATTPNLTQEAGLPLPLPTTQPTQETPPATQIARFPGSLAPPPSQQAQPDGQQPEVPAQEGGIDDETLARLAEMVRQRAPQQPAEEMAAMSAPRVRGVSLDRIRSVLAGRGPLGTGAKA